MIKKLLFAVLLTAFVGTAATAQIGKGKLGAALGAAKAVTVSDAEIIASSKEAVRWMDENNPVCTLDDSDPTKKAYAERLEKIFAPYQNYDGLDLNYKVYYVIDINAFATFDGSIRVFAGLMDLMTDEEILGVIGHEIGHVKLEHSKKGYRQALLTTAAADYAKSTSGVAATLTNTQLGELATALTSAQFSQQHETQADNYSYKFMLDSGLDPMNLASAFRKLSELSGGDKQNLGQKLMSSHPDSGNRADKIEERIQKDKK